MASLAGCAGGARYPISDHFDGSKFHNPVPLHDPTAWELAVHIATGRSTPWPEFVPNWPSLDVRREVEAGEVAITHVNHATMLLQVQGWNVLTDPVWSDRVGPWSWAGPKRVRAPGVPFGALPKIDVVLISHNHYDHLDLPTLRLICARDAPLVVVPLGDRALLEGAGIGRVVELDWWDVARAGEGLEVVFTPAQHNSGRWPWTARESLWGGFMVRFGDGDEAGQVFFGGDTAYSAHFEAIRARLGAPDIALLPIGAYAPRATMRAYHMDPADAVRAHRVLGAGLSVGMHHGTFQLTNEPVDQPVVDLAQARAEAGVAEEAFVVLGEGRTRRVRMRALSKRDAAPAQAQR